MTKSEMVHKLLELSGEREMAQIALTKAMGGLGELLGKIAEEPRLRTYFTERAAHRQPEVMAHIVALYEEVFSEELLGEMIGLFSEPVWARYRERCGVLRTAMEETVGTWGESLLQECMAFAEKLEAEAQAK